MPKKILPVLLLNFVNVLGFSLLIPILPYIVDKYVGENSPSNPIIFGLLLSSYSAFQFLATPVLGAMSDHYGRRSMLILSQLGTLLCWVIMCIAYWLPETKVFGSLPLPLWIIFFARIVDGITGGNNSIASAYLSDITKPEERTKIFAMIGGVIGFAFIIGPAAGGLTYTLGYEYFGTSVLATFISLITLIVIILYLPESLDPSHRSEHMSWGVLKKINVIAGLRSFGQNPILKSLFARRIVFGFVFSSYTSVLVLFIYDIFEATPLQLGALFLIVGMFGIFNQLVISHRVSKRFGEKRALNIGAFFITIGMCLLSLVGRNFILFFIFYYIINLGVSLSMPTFRSILAHNLDKKKQGEGMGLDESIMAGNAAIAPTIITSLYAGLQNFETPALLTSIYGNDIRPAIFVLLSILIAISAAWWQFGDDNKEKF